MKGRENSKYMRMPREMVRKESGRRLGDKAGRGDEARIHL